MKSSILKKTFFSTMLLAIFLFLVAVPSSFAAEVIFSNPSPIRAGRYAEVTIQTRIPDVLDSPRDDITYKIRTTDDIRPVQGQEFTIGRANPGQIITRTFTIYFSENIQTGFFPLELIEIRGGEERRRTINVFVEGRADAPELRIGRVSSIPNRLIKDTNDNVIHIDIMNLGEIDAELVTVNLVSDSEIISETFFGSLEDTRSSIRASESQRFEFELDISDTEEKHIESYLDLTYRMRIDNTYEVSNVQIPFELRLADTPRFEILSITPKDNLRVGESNLEIIVEIKNTGERNGENVRFRLYPNPESPFDFERTTIFVSSLIEPGETAKIRVPFDILDTALVQSYNINAEFESTIGANRYTQRDRLEIDVEFEANPAISSYAILIVVGGIVVSLGIGLSRRKPSKKR